MNMPGFAAELSLSPVTKSFGGRLRNPVAGNTVEAALLHCNQACLDDCLFDLSDCDGLPMPRTGTMLALCHQAQHRAPPEMLFS